MTIDLSILDKLRRERPQSMDFQTLEEVLTAKLILMSCQSYFLNVRTINMDGASVGCKHYRGDEDVSCFYQAQL